jgi:putative phosphoesterase
VIVAVIADTHVPPRAPDLPPAAWRIIESADALIHAGDIVSDTFLTRLRQRITTHAVRGNNDLTLDILPETLQLHLAGVRIGVIHDSGPAAGRRERMRARFPHCRAVVFGHSHIPLLEDDGSLLLLNPGSATDRRRQPAFTMARLTLTGGAIAHAEVIDLGIERATR